MLDLKTVLPNFICTALVATAAISFSAFAQYEEQATDAAVEGAAEITDAAEGTMTEAKEYSAEAIDGYKEVTETAEELEEEAEVIESE